MTEFSAATWAISNDYLFGVDLFNFAYWWECHEQWEAIWKCTGPESFEGRFLQGMVQIAAANLRKFMGSHDSGVTLARKGVTRLRDFEDDIVLGIEVASFITEVQKHFDPLPGRPPVIDLRFPACSLNFSTNH